MEFESLVRRSSLTRKTLRGMLAATVILATTFLAAPAWAQEAAETAAPAAPATAPAAAPADSAAAEEAGMSPTAIRNVAIVIALFVVPILIGNTLAKSLKMPDYGWKFAVAIGTLAAAAVVVALGEIKLGPDLSGGITLIYEIEKREGAENASPVEKQPLTEEEMAAEDKELTEEGAEEVAEDDKDPAAEKEGFASLNRSDTMAALIKALIERVDPSGTKEVSIKKFGDDQIEIIIPKAEKAELEAIERRIYTAGVLEFRITASRQFDQHRAIIDLAEALPANQNIVRIEGKEVARWVEYDEKQFGSPEQADGTLVVRTTSKVPQALVLTNDGLNVTGEYLRSAAPDVDQTGRPAVTFIFNSQGAFRFERLTRAHQPTASGAKYNLGIMLDNRLLSAPNLNAVISDRGIIEGLDDQEEVEFLVGILNAGSLPAALNKVPISRAQISPTLGQLTIEKGQQALLISLVLVAIFMVVYYKKAGFISWLGLAANMLLILGCMVLIKAAFTLPGLAGLVLTVGMSVDANVLIYERIRDELKRGAALRMAIRNGFDRASITIIDSNVTNLITGIVIYKIAPDSVKGFGVTLVLGILMSVFTAVFLTRIVFDVAERRGWLKNMSMREFIGETHIDFVGWRTPSIIASLVVIGIGLTAAFSRGQDLFDIDFTGGSSVTIVFDDDKQMPYAEVYETLQKTPLGEANLSLVKVGDDDSRYTVTTINDDVVGVEEILQEAFGDKLKKYQVDIEEVKEIAPGSQTSAVPAAESLKLFNGLGLASPLSYVTLLQPVETEAAAETEATPPAEEESVTADPPPADEAAAEPAEAESTPAAEPAKEEATTAPVAEEPASSDAKPSETPASTDAAAASASAADPFAGGASAKLKFAADKEGDVSGVTHDTLQQMIGDALAKADKGGVPFTITNEDYREGSNRPMEEWQVSIALPPAEAQAIFDQLAQETNTQPVFPLSSKIGGRVAGQMATSAIAAMILCLIGIIAYVWFRFHGVIYGVAAVVALIHDVLVTLGFVALSSYFVNGAGSLSSALLIDKFQINLTLVAAFLTIIGYSLNDTIVIFDRIREVKGKSPRLTKEIINLAVNQTLARTILTSFTTLTSVIVLYIFGGDGIHAFAFALLVGFVAGCYSTIYIANPVLLWLAERFEGGAETATAKAA
jgi:SecD/SecF fusion protein